MSAAQERAQIVAWLRTKAYSFRTPMAGLAMDTAYRAWRDASEAIERGDHIPKPEPRPTAAEDSPDCGA